jgi:hypothetical protein
MRLALSMKAHDHEVRSAGWSPNFGESGLQMDSGDLFHNVEAHESFSYVYVLLGFGVGGPGEIRTHDLFHAI